MTKITDILPNAIIVFSVIVSRRRYKLKFLKPGPEAVLVISSLLTIAPQKWLVISSARSVFWNVKQLCRISFVENYGQALHGFTHPDESNDDHFHYEQVAEERSWESMDHFLQELGFREEVVTEFPIRTEDVVFMDGDRQMFGHMAYPEGVTDAPVVLHVYAYNGNAEFSNSRAERTAAELGYIGLSFSIYYEEEITALAEDGSMANRIAYSRIYDNDPELYRSRISAAVNFAKNHLNVNEFAGAGYCAGGTALLQYARLGGDELSAIVSFHGGLDSVVNQVSTYCPTRIAVFNGAADFLIPESKIQQLEEALEVSGTYWESTNYDYAQHGFTHPNSDDDHYHYEVYAEKRSWNGMQHVLADAFEGKGISTSEQCEVYVPTTTEAPTSNSAACVDDDAGVNAIAGQFGITECRVQDCEGSFSAQIVPLCPLTCGTCTVDDSCQDDNEGVAEIAGAFGVYACASDYCEGPFSAQIAPLCPRTCGICPENTNTEDDSCQDDNEGVAEVAGAFGVNACAPEYCEGPFSAQIAPLCPRTCGTCPENTNTEDDSCQDDNEGVVAIAGAFGVTGCAPEYCTGDFSAQIAPLCPKTCGTCPEDNSTSDTSEESSDSECSNDDTLAVTLLAGASDMNINDCDSLKRWGELNLGEMFACDTFVTTITEFGMLNTEVEVAGTLTDICCEACTDTMACTLDVDSYQPESGECEEGEESFAFCEMTQCISNSDCTYDDFGLDNPDDEHICPTELTEHEFLYQDDDGNEMVGYLIFPSDMDTSMLHPGVVVYGGFTGDGGQRMEREYAREYARKGMVAFLPDYFPGRHDQDDFDQVMDAAIQYSTLFQDGVRAQRLAILAYEQLTSLPYVDSDRVGAFGFCFGGAMAMQAARAGANWKVAAGLHAEYPPMTEYIGDSWDMEYFAEFAGDSDPFIPPDHIEGWNEELSNSGSDYEVTMIENGLHGFAMKYSLASYQVLATLGGQTLDDIIYDEEGTAIGITGTFLYVEEQRDLAFNRIEELFEEYGLFTGGVAAEESTEGPSESTEGPSTCGCGEEIGSAFSNLEEQLQTQMAALMTERLPAELETLLSERLQAALTAALPDNFVTAEDFAMLQDKVGDLEMDNNDVMNGMSDMATCMADIAGSMGGDRGDDSYEETDAPAVETAAPTEYWETIGRLMEGGNNKCSTSDADRAFRLSFTSLENCLTRCSNDARCQFASTNFMSDSSTKYCIGCINLTQAADGWMAYEMLNDRRQLSSVKQLSEVERLRAENQRLRAELAEARRN